MPKAKFYTCLLNGREVLVETEIWQPREQNPGEIGGEFIMHVSDKQTGENLYPQTEEDLQDLYDQIES